MNPTEANDLEAGREEDAAGWLLEREDGFAPGRAEAFAAWRGGDQRNAAAFARVERTLAILDEMPAVRGPLEVRVGPAAREEARVKSPVRATDFRRWAWVTGMAAAVVIGASTWRALQSPTAAAQVYEAIGTDPRRVSLADGSVVDLNSNSRVEVQFSEGERHVTLVTGEAHFQVAHNQARPFIVAAHGISVRAVGTAFDVRLAGDHVDVLVVEGKVEVAHEAAGMFSAAKKTPLVPLLVAGERTQVDVRSEATARVEEIAPGEAHALLSWQNRMTSFVDVPLREMVDRINRCNALQLVIGDPQLGDRKVGGVIDLSQVTAFVRLLEQEGDIIADRGADGKIVLRRAR